MRATRSDSLILEDCWVPDDSVIYRSDDTRTFRNNGLNWFWGSYTAVYLGLAGAAYDTLRDVVTREAGARIRAVPCLASGRPPATIAELPALSGGSPVDHVSIGVVARPAGAIGRGNRGDVPCQIHCGPDNQPHHARGPDPRAERTGIFKRFSVWNNCFATAPGGNSTTSIGFLLVECGLARTRSRPGGADASRCGRFKRIPSMSLSRQFAAFVADLKYEDLPSAVVDRAKGVTLRL